MRTLNCSIVSLSVLCVAFFGLGIAVQFAINDVVKSQADAMIPLKNNDSALFQPWVDHGGYGSPIYNHNYIWNITNWEAYAAGDEEPRMEAVGPFVYRLFNWRENVSWDGDEIKFTYHNYNVFLPERTPRELDLDAKVTVPNFALSGLWNTIQGMNRTTRVQRAEYYAALNLMKRVLKTEGESIFLHRSIRQILWGFEDPLLASIIVSLKELNITIPDGLTSFVGLQEIDTKAFYEKESVQWNGISDFKRTAQFTEWCGETNLSKYWPDATKLTGSDGWQFSPSPDDRIPLFVDALPAVVDIERGPNVDVLGIHSWRYHIAPDTWDNTSAFGKSHFLNSPNGVLNLTYSQTASIFISKPYFLDADPMYTQMVTLPREPQDDLDNTYIYIEPITGSGVAAQQRLQINLEMDASMCELDTVHNCSLERAFIPMMITNQYIEIPPNQADNLKSQIYGLPHTVKILGWVMFGSAFLLVFWAFMLWRTRRKVKAITLDGTIQEGPQGYDPVPQSDPDDLDPNQK